MSVVADVIIFLKKKKSQMPGQLKSYVSLIMGSSGSIYKTVIVASIDDRIATAIYYTKTGVLGMGYI